MLVPYIIVNYGGRKVFGGVNVGVIHNSELWYALSLLKSLRRPTWFSFVSGLKRYPKSFICVSFYNNLFML